MHMNWIKQISFVLAAWLAASEAAFAYCAMCQTALASSPEGQQLAKGINNGILFLLGAPFLVAGLAALLIVKAQSGIPTTAATSDSDLLLPHPIPPQATLPAGGIRGDRKQQMLPIHCPSTRDVPTQA